MGNKHSLNSHPSTAAVDEFKQYPQHHLQQRQQQQHHHHHQQSSASPRGAFYLQQWATTVVPPDPPPVVVGQHQSPASPPPPLFMNGGVGGGTCRNGTVVMMAAAAPPQQQCNGGTTTAPSPTAAELWQNGKKRQRRKKEGEKEQEKRNSRTEMTTPKSDNNSNSPLPPSSRNSTHSGDATAAATAAPPLASASSQMAENHFAASADGTPRRNGGGGFLAQLFNHSAGRQQKKAFEAAEKQQQQQQQQQRNNHHHHNQDQQHQVPNGTTAVPTFVTAPAANQQQQQQQQQQMMVPPQIEQHNNNHHHHHLQQQQQPFVLLPDRPAIRLDSRLVCKYEVLAVVGKGSFSQVLRVQDRISKRFYAVKLVSTEQDFGAVNNELSILSRVQHPFVIRLEEVFRSATKLFIVMEMASGGEMYDRVVSKGRYTESEARLAIKMLLNGLEYLHSMHITHRDLKPENLLYSDTRQDARLLITDFGLAHQARSQEEKMTETCGTPEYIAPEILLRIPYTNRVDLWAVGVIAYILMSGIMPFDDDCRSRLYTQIITANYVYYQQFWSGSEQAKHFVDTLLDTSPDHRPSAGDALCHHWVTGERPSQLNGVAMGNSYSSSRRTRTRIEADELGADDDDGTTTGSAEDANGTTVQRTKSSRSVRSVTRSDHGHRVDPREVDQLAEDLQRLAQKQREREQRHQHHHHNNHHHHPQQQHARTTVDGGGGGARRHHYSSPYATQQQKQPITKNYGVF